MRVCFAAPACMLGGVYVLTKLSSVDEWAPFPGCHLHTSAVSCSSLVSENMMPTVDLWNNYCRWTRFIFRDNDIGSDQYTVGVFVTY